MSLLLFFGDSANDDSVSVVETTAAAELAGIVGESLVSSKAFSVLEPNGRATVESTAAADFHTLDGSATVVTTASANFVALDGSLAVQTQATGALHSLGSELSTFVETTASAGLRLAKELQGALAVETTAQAELADLSGTVTVDTTVSATLSIPAEPPFAVVAGVIHSDGFEVATSGGSTAGIIRSGGAQAVSGKAAGAVYNS